MLARPLPSSAPVALSAREGTVVRMTRVLIGPFACVLLWFSGTGHAESVVRADEEPVVLHLMAVDDGITCALNGRDVAAQARGQGAVRRDITPDLKRGRNALRCRIADKDGGP